MFFNNIVTISSQDETRALTPVYTDIQAQIYKKTVRSNNDISENTFHEITVVLIEADRVNVREWNQVQYLDKFWIIRKVKVWNMEYIDALHFNKLIELRCDLV